jgi:hypothetical protein
MGLLTGVKVYWWPSNSLTHSKTIPSSPTGWPSSARMVKVYRWPSNSLTHSKTSPRSPTGRPSSARMEGHQQTLKYGIGGFRTWVGPQYSAFVWIMRTKDYIHILWISRWDLMRSGEGKRRGQDSNPHPRTPRAHALPLSRFASCIVLMIVRFIYRPLEL